MRWIIEFIVFFVLLLIIGILPFIINQDEYRCLDEKGRDECIINLVRENNEKDVLTCNKTITDEYRNLCYFLVSENNYMDERIRICAMINITNESVYYNRQNCYFVTAIMEKNAEYCMLINDSRINTCIIALKTDPKYEGFFQSSSASG
jgi:hypothetical protein